MQCVNKNTREYQTLKDRSGLPDFILSAEVGMYLEKLGRYPYLDELPKANSEKAIKKDLLLNSKNATNTSNILESTNSETIEEAIPKLNDKYRDKEIEVLEMEGRSKVYITPRPTTSPKNLSNIKDKILLEITDIKARAIVDGTFMKAPNGNPTNLNEDLWLLVRTSVFKDWFGDWENNPTNASKVVDENGEPKIVYHGSKTEVSVFDSSKSDARYTLSKTIKPTNFFSDDKTVANAFARTEKQSIANAIAASLNEVAEAQIEDEDEVWNHVANSVNRPVDWVKNFWLNELSMEERLDASDGVMYDPNVEKQKYQVFLNMKNPVFIDAKGERADRVLEKNKNIINNNDEVIILNVDETVGKQETATDYLVRKPDQIKSATLNTNEFSKNIKEKEDSDINNFEDTNSFLYLNLVLEKLLDLYGINIIPISNAELTSPDWERVAGVHGAKAFVYQGNIYVNTDIATIDSPLHEMLHILFGSMKFLNRKLYEQLVSSAELFNQGIIEMYPNRTREDINEEAFVTELSKYLTNQPSALDLLDDAIKLEIFYNVTRTLDSILMGEASVKCIPEKTLYRLNLKTVAEMVRSVSMVSDFNGTMDNATLNRILANKKQDLIEKGLLREECS